MISFLDNYVKVRLKQFLFKKNMMLFYSLEKILIRRRKVKLNKILGTIFLFSVLILCACSDGEKKYNIFGESNNWIVKYETEVTKEREFGEFTIKYIGKEPAPEVFVYKIKNPSTSLDVGIGEETFNNENNVHSFNVECTGCEVYTSENDTIEAKLDWNGKSEIIKLDSK